MAPDANIEHPQPDEEIADGTDPGGGEPSLASQLSVESLLESLSEGVVVADSAGKIVLVNRRTEEIFGYRRSELLGQPLAMLLPSRFVASHSRMLSQYFANPTLRHMDSGFDLVGQRRDGVEIPLEIGLNQLPGAAGPMSIATLVDISRRKRTEVELKQRNDELNSFTQTLAHDLRGTLAIVKGFGELLLEDLDVMAPDEVRRYLTIMMSNSGKMAEIISGLMLLASTSQKDIPVVPVDMTACLEGAMEKLAADVEELAGELVLPDNLPAVNGHAPWLEAVWVTLIGNAIRRSGQPAQVEVGSQRLENGAVTFWVKDNGAGIPPASLKKIFAPAEGIQLPTSASSGVSLDIVQRMIERLDGQVRAESAARSGSTFSFTLPGSAEPPKDQ